ncbi:MAG TPA: TMEM165/GDT1 family protein [Nostocaceae cyanobacterium]|nr:TMEM165/GDT1 family protein [Nostocaceae cyanobacterium]
MKLDSKPVSISDTSPTTSQLDIQNSSNVTLQPVSGDSLKREPLLITLSTTFITIFLAEIGDKTQLSTLLMSAESHAPWVVFLGSGAALITTSLLGVLLGGWIASKLSPKTVEKSAGVMLLIISLMLVWDVIKN